MDDFERLREAAAQVRIVHHLSGRLRMKLDARPPALRLPPHVRRREVHELVADIEGVYAVRINVLARSCTVEYDPAVIPDEAWGDFLRGVPSPAAAVLEAILRAKYEEIVHEQL